MDLEQPGLARNANDPSSLNLPTLYNGNELRSAIERHDE